MVRMLNAIAMSVLGKKISKFGCVKILDNMIIMRVVSQANRSHVHLLKYTEKAEQSTVSALAEIFSTYTVGRFVTLLAELNQADILSRVPPVAKRCKRTEKQSMQPWKLVLCIDDGPNDLFKVLEDDFLLCDIPTNCCDALVIFTDAKSLQNTLNVAHGPTLPCFFDSFANLDQSPLPATELPIANTAAEPQLHRASLRSFRGNNTDAKGHVDVKVIWFAPRSEPPIPRAQARGYEDPMA